MKILTDEELAQVLDKDIFRRISTAADKLGVDCYVVGGYVRDIFLERPSNDIDVVVVGSGISVASELKQMLGRKARLTVFRNFGTAQVKFRDIEVEFVGARRESYRADSRKPIVEEGSIDDDQKRRDFTINALAISLNRADYGELIDPFGGVEHLEQRIIRTPLEPGLTFSDDPLRMMRAVRFASQLNFRIEENTLRALSEYAFRLPIISMERIMDEFNKIMLSPEPSKGISLLEETGLLKQFFPELVALKGVEHVNGVGHKDNFYHTLAVVDGVALYSEDLWLRWAALLHDIGKPVTKKFSPAQGGRSTGITIRENGWYRRFSRA